MGDQCTNHGTPEEGRHPDYREMQQCRGRELDDVDSEGLKARLEKALNGR